MNQCSAERAGVAGCYNPIGWVIKAADKKMFACGTHLNRVCLQMLQTGVEYMTISILDC
jgi:hypothetical protein